MVTSVMLYGCEIWGFCNFEILERLHLRFCKILLKLKKSTPNVMVYGELGRYPMSVTIKTRMICYWYKLSRTKCEGKYSSILYKLLYKLQDTNTIRYDTIR